MTITTTIAKKARAHCNYYANYLDCEQDKAFKSWQCRTKQPTQLFELFNLTIIKHNNRPSYIEWNRRFVFRYHSCRCYLFETINKTLIVFFRCVHFCLIGGFLSDLTTICTHRKTGRKLVRTAWLLCSVK